MTLDTTVEKLTVKAEISSIEQATAFVEERLERDGCPMKAQMQLAVAIDEILSNIASYAYGPEGGEATLEYEHGEGRVKLTFTDSGRPYDPLGREDPDTTLPAEEREPGGLGIFMVKRTMDDCGYEYRDGRNVFWIVKKV